MWIIFLFSIAVLLVETVFSKFECDTDIWTFCPTVESNLLAILSSVLCDFRSRFVHPKVNWSVRPSVLILHIWSSLSFHSLPYRNCGGSVEIASSPRVCKLVNLTSDSLIGRWGCRTDATKIRRLRALFSAGFTANAAVHGRVSVRMEILLCKGQHILYDCFCLKYYLTT